MVAPSPRPTPDVRPTPLEAAQYIQELTGELAGLAAEAGLARLAFLLREAMMAAEEASQDLAYPTREAYPPGSETA